LVEQAEHDLAELGAGLFGSVFERQGPGDDFAVCVVASIRVFLDRLPIGGFTGGVMLSPIGTVPPVSEPPPRRPGQVDEDDELDS
jgi:hypothetical protein